MRYPLFCLSSKSMMYMLAWSDCFQAGAFSRTVQLREAVILCSSRMLVNEQWNIIAASSAPLMLCGGILLNLRNFHTTVIFGISQFWAVYCSIFIVSHQLGAICTHSCTTEIICVYSTTYNFLKRRIMIVPVSCALESTSAQMFCFMFLLVVFSCLMCSQYIYIFWF